MFIKVLSLCAALLAPESTGHDPHGRALHLPLHEDFNISYEACIVTAKQAKRYNIDPFVAVALAYQTTKMSPELARKSKVYHQIQAEYGCRTSDFRYIKSSCSPFMLTSLNLAVLISKYQLDYPTALCSFLSGNGRCTSKGRREAKIIENMSRRFANVYSRTHTSFQWKDPFVQRQERFHRPNEWEDQQIDYLRHLQRPPYPEELYQNDQIR